MSDQEALTRLIIRAQSGFFSVLSADADSPVTCQLRRRLKQGPKLGDIASVGDSVLFTNQPDEQRRHR